jgi:hypothetical protein
VTLHSSVSSTTNYLDLHREQIEKPIVQSKKEHSSWELLSSREKIRRLRSEILLLAGPSKRRPCEFQGAEDRCFEG